MARIRVTLKSIKILDDLDPFYKETGEFRFRSRVSSESGEGFEHETRFPEEGHYSLSDKPGWNYVTLNKTLYEGDADNHLVVELFGEEIDLLSANDELDHYKREHRGPLDDWVGLYEPRSDEKLADQLLHRKDLEKDGFLISLSPAAPSESRPRPNRGWPSPVECRLGRCRAARPSLHPPKGFRGANAP